MFPPNPKLWLTALLLMVACAVWPVLRLDQAEATLIRSQQDLDDCQRLVDEISKLRSQPTSVGVQELAAPQLADLIDQAADIAGMDQNQIERVWPSAPRRIEKTSYKALPTRIMLREVTMHQALTFLNTLRNGEAELSVTEVRFSASRQNEQKQERWAVETVVSYLIYSPSAPS